MMVLWGETAQCKAGKCSQNAVENVSKLCQIRFQIGVQILQISRMFESSQFLDLYLPSYFENVYERTYSSSSPQKMTKSEVELVASFLRFSHQLYTTMGKQHQFNEFLFTQFSMLNLKEGAQVSKSFKKEQNKKMRKIIEFIESNIDKVSLTFVQLYLKLFQIQRLTCNLIPGKDTASYSQKLIKALNEAKLQYQVYRFEINDTKDYDDYALEIFSLLFQENVSLEMENIIKIVLDSQYSNLNQAIIPQIQSYLNRNKAALCSSPLEPNPEKDKLKFLKNVLRKKAKKFDKLKGSPLQKKLIHSQINGKKEPLFLSPNKNSGIKHRESHSPLNRIQNYAKIKKQKPINKKRTIYYQRKNLHLPKMREWIDKMESYPSELTFASMDKEREKKRSFKFENSQSTYDDLDNESVLVRSTPKPAKKMTSMKIISHKLDF